ncbi:tyrosine-protein phosphatase [Actinomadura sp. WAC 06369]|uniref:tyrosine-protein phosphatase n=1 Tax=Actinomadura sp. WAC 06369 TaxID=2203193 RepID=UPI000F79D127|nr:tyrosine-protein phosphatase [Actinomadura sp. WAC 06369]RSN67531.1 protein-tyrosine-phosphatase [Actinomadura sp. WAC 06369]
MRRTPVLAAAVLAAPLFTVPSALAAPAAPPGVVQRHGGHGHGSRLVGVEGTINLRDLGGYETYFHARVRSGVIYRADALDHVTDAGLAKLRGLGVERVVDFRTPLEVSTDGPDRLPDGLRATARPIGDTGMFAAVNAAIGSKDPARQEAVLGDGRGAAIMRTLYRSFVTDPESAAAFGRTLRETADRANTPLVFHCTSGKDRTGWMSYLLLRAVGVPHRTAMHDYLLSNQYRAEADAAVRARLKAAGYMQNAELLKPIQDVRPEYLEAALDEVRREYGSVERYLRKGLGIDGRTRAKLRHHLLTRH